MKALSDLSIGIAGMGIVGSALYKAFKGYPSRLVGYDCNQDKTIDSLSQLYSCDLIFVCLPTPQLRDRNGLDTSILDDFFSNLPNYAKEKSFVIKSTVPIGYTRGVVERFGIRNVVHSPEFLTARYAEKDAAKPVCNVLGYPGGQTFRLTPSSVNFRCLYETRWPHVPLMCVESKVSEAIKLLCNAYYAMKVTIFNEFKLLCDEEEIPYDIVVDGMLSQGWIDRHHTEVPGPDGMYGFGGDCLPKDLSEVVRVLTSVYETVDNTRVMDSIHTILPIAEFIQRYNQEVFRKRKG